MNKETFKIVATYIYSSEAIIFKGKLESEGIEAFLRDNFTIDTDPLVSNAVGGVKLYVKSEDFDRAIEILDSIPKYELTDDGKPIVCPKCGGNQVQQFSVIDDAKSFLSMLIALLFIVLPLYIKRRYRCKTCHFEFKKEKK